MTALRDLLKDAQPRSRSVALPLDGDAVAAFQTQVETVRRIEAELTAAQLQGSKKRAEQLQDDLDKATRKQNKLEKPVKASTVEFKFAAVGSRRYMDIVAEHAPTDEQAAEGHDVNPETFYPAVMAESMVEPEASEDDIRELETKLTTGDWEELKHACRSANIARSQVGFTSGRS